MAVRRPLRGCWQIEVGLAPGCALPDVCEFKDVDDEVTVVQMSTTKISTLVRTRNLVVAGAREHYPLLLNRGDVGWFSSPVVV